MKRLRVRLLLLGFAITMLLISVSCGSQRYSSQSRGHPKGCDCPRFK